MQDLSCRSLADVPVADVLALLRVALPDGALPRSERFWRWKHACSPFGPSEGLAAFDGADLVGLRAFMRWRWAVDGRSVDAVRAVDTVTHPDWRRRGLFRRLTLDLVKQLEGTETGFVFNTPNKRSRAGYLKMGWMPVCRVPIWVRPRRLARLLGGSARAAVVPPGGRATSNSTSLLAQEQVEEFVGTDLWRTDGRLHTGRSAGYLRWRYADAVGIEYRVAGAPSADTGLVVARLRERRARSELALAELLVGDGPGAVARLAGEVRHLAEKLDVDYTIAVAASKTPEASVLKTAGFVKAPALGPFLVVRRIDRSATTPTPPLERWGSWRLSLGDLEVF